MSSFGYWALSALPNSKLSPVPGRNPIKRRSGGHSATLLSVLGMSSASLQTTTTRTRIFKAWFPGALMRVECSFRTLGSEPSSGRILVFWGEQLDWCYQHPCQVLMISRVISIRAKSQETCIIHDASPYLSLNDRRLQSAAFFRNNYLISLKIETDGLILRPPGLFLDQPCCNLVREVTTNKASPHVTSKPLHRYIESRFDSRFADPPGLIRVLGALSRLKPKEKSAIARGRSPAREVRSPSK